MNCVSCDICVYHLWFVCAFSPIPQLQSDWSLSREHGLDYASQCQNNSSNNNNYRAILARVTLYLTDKNTFSANVLVQRS